jgi:hypothetical protein
VDSTTTTTASGETSTTVPAPTTVAPTTVAPTSVAPTTVPAPTTTAPPAPARPAPATAFAILEGDLVELDAANGDVVTTLAEFFEDDGLFRGDLELSPDRSTLYFSEGYEDSWFACESSVGAIGRVDFATRAVEIVAEGWSPSVSPDGARLAFVTSSLCLPDPDEPELWVLTPADRVVVLDLATSARVEIVSTSPPTAYDDPAAIDWASFHPSGDLLVATADGNVRRVPSTEDGTVQSNPIVSDGEPAFPVAAFEQSLVVMEVGDEGAIRMVEIDLDSGASTPVWDSEFFVAANGDRDGHVIVIDAAADETTITSNLHVLALDAFASGVAW